MFRFFQNDDGAVTVDWVVLCAGLVMLGLAVMATVAGPANQNAEKLGTYLSSQTISTY